MSRYPGLAAIRNTINPIAASAIGRYFFYSILDALSISISIANGSKAEPK